VARLKEEAEARRLEAEAEAKRLEAEAEAKRLEAEAEANRLEAEAEARRLEAEAEAKRLEEEAVARLKKEAEAKRLEAEAEARRLEEGVVARLRKEAEARRLEAEAQAKRLEEEAVARLKKEAEARRLEVEAEAKRLEEEAEAKRLEAEAEAKRLEEEAEARRLEAEAEAKRLEAEAEAKGLEAEAEAKRLEAERRSRLVRARLAEVASPAPSIAPDGRLDAGPNEVYDSPTEDNDLPALRIQQRAVISTILSDLPSNAPSQLKSSLESYDDELRARGVQPILGLLKIMAEIIEAAIGAPNARPEWLEDGMCAAFKAFSDNHALFVKHFPLDPQREDLYAVTPVDESSATGSKLFGPFQEVAAATVEANKGRPTTTDNFRKVAETVADFAKVISSLPPTAYSGLPTVDLIPPVSIKKRIILSGLGFFERAYNLLGTTVSLASPEGVALLTGLRSAVHNAIDALSKSL
jgi:hypothetical protein